MYEEEKAKLRLYKDYVVRVLRPSYIRVFMTAYLDNECVEQILSVEEQHSVTTAAEKLLEKVCLLDAPGWYQNFLETLDAEGYTGLSSALQQGDFSWLESTREHRFLLERIEPSFTSNINPAHLLPHLSACLIDRDIQEIQRKQELYGEKAAAVRLIDCFRRSDCPTWFKQLKDALYECEFTPALNLLCGDEGSEKGEDEEGEDKVDATMMTVSIHYMEGSDEDDDEGLLKSANQMTIDEGASAETRAGPEAVVLRSRSGGEKKLRRYQTELAQPVYEGKNTIICAPTGCGKTVVALAISENHLATRGEGAKVVFMATKVDVFNQQLQLFTQHFREKAGEIRIQGLCGSQEDQLSLSVVVETNDIIIVTPQILVNSLTHNDLKSLSCFSLLIFDECHNTTGKHPYNIIMTHYLDAKLGSTGETLPQIVGLTASVGIGSFKNQQDAEINICQLCANLDTQVISTVQENIEELRSYVHTPEKEFVLVERRESDPFIRIICDIMKRIEALAKDVYNIDSLSPILNRDYGSQKYEQWIVDVQKRCRILRLTDQDESRVCRALYNYTEHLRKYNDALIINEDARTKDALDFLSAFIEQVKNAGHDTTERQLTQFFDAHEAQLRELASGGQYVNPKLSELQFILQEKYRAEPDTRTILFVRTRALADALKRWMEETDCLKHLKPGVLIGRGRRSQLTTSGHMTLNSKKGVLDSFKSSTNQSKILIATSVADEGIDVPQCNLVLMYEYVGNVVKMVQVRGRGRAQGSVCILVSSKKERINKEKMNVYKERIVEAAIIKLQETLEDTTRKMCVFQREDKVRRQQERLAPERPRVDGSFSLLCSKCRKVTACTSDDIRVLQNSHHIVVNRSLFSHATTRPHPRPISYGGWIKTRKLFCGGCALDWGIVATFQNIPDLPVLKIESFVVEDNRVEPKKLQYFRKWRDVNFSMRDFNVTDIPANWGPLPDDQ